MKKIMLAIAMLATSGVVFTAFRQSVPVAPEKSSVPAAAPARASGKWVVDKAHSNVRFTVTHMVVSEMEGSFKNFDGSMEHTKADFSDAKISWTIDVASIDTDNDGRDRHLKGEDFFAADKYPQIRFQSTAFTPLGDNKYKLEGNLTVRDVTKPVVFDVTYGGSIDTQRGAKAGFKAKTTINRFDYGLKWNRLTEAGGLSVGKDVAISVNVELDEVKEPKK